MFINPVDKQLTVHFRETIQIHFRGVFCATNNSKGFRYFVVSVNWIPWINMNVRRKHLSWSINVHATANVSTFLTTLMILFFRWHVIIMVASAELSSIKFITRLHSVTLGLHLNLVWRLACLHGATSYAGWLYSSRMNVFHQWLGLISTNFTRSVPVNWGICLHFY